MSTLLFCPTCQTYLRPSDTDCPTCGRKRLPTELPARPEQPFWQASLPGTACGQPLVCGELVVFAWGTRSGGGLTALNRLSGAECWIKEVDLIPRLGPVSQGDRLYLAASWAGRSTLTCNHLADGEYAWQPVTFAGTVCSLPLLGEKRVCIAADNGMLHAYDSQDGQVVRGWPVRLEAGKTWLLPMQTKLLAVCESGAVYLLDAYSAGSQSRPAFSFGVHLSSPPVLHKNTLYCGAEGGVLLVANLREPHPRQLASGFKKLAAAPICASEALYAAGYDHSLRAIHPQTGNELWEARLPLEHSVSAALDGQDGLLAVCENDGMLHIVEAGSGREAWKFQFPNIPRLPGGPRLADGIVYAAGDNLAVAFPWHQGHYAWAAEFERKRGNLMQSGEFSALAGFYTRAKIEKERFYLQAAAAWDELGEPEWTARMWEGFDDQERAAIAYCCAAESSRDCLPRQAADFYMRASQLFWQLGNTAEMETCARKAAGLGSWPLIRLSLWRPSSFIQGQRGDVTLRLENIGKKPAYAPLIKVGGSLLVDTSYQITQPLPPRSYFDITLDLIPAKIDNQLVFQVEYWDQPSGPNTFRASLSADITADRAPIKVTRLDLMKTDLKIHITDPNQQVIIDDVMGYGGSLEVVIGKSGAAPSVSPMSHPCPACGRENDIDARFCAYCQQALASN